MAPRLPEVFASLVPPPFGLEGRHRRCSLHDCASILEYRAIIQHFLLCFLAGAIGPTSDLFALGQVDEAIATESLPL